MLTPEQIALALDEMQLAVAMPLELRIAAKLHKAGVDATEFHAARRTNSLFREIPHPLYSRVENHLRDMQVMRIPRDLPLLFEASSDLDFRVEASDSNMFGI